MDFFNRFFGKKKKQKRKNTNYKPKVAPSHPSPQQLVAQAKRDFENKSIPELVDIANPSTATI